MGRRYFYRVWCHTCADAVKGWTGLVGWCGTGNTAHRLAQRHELEHLGAHDLQVEDYSRAGVVRILASDGQVRGEVRS